MIRIILWPTLIAGLFFSSCKKDKKSGFTDDYFMEAYIDGIRWRTTGVGYARFYAHYDNSDQRFTIILHGSDPDQKNPVVTGIATTFDFVPKKGRYYFNNIGDLSLDSGTTGIYYYYKINRVTGKLSNSGYIDIDSISKDAILGKFNFTATGDITNPQITSITNGSFKVAYGGSSGLLWPGP